MSLSSGRHQLHVVHDHMATRGVNDAHVVLVTGATGRIGRHVVDRLLAAGMRARILVRTTSVTPPGWDHVQKVTGDLDDAASLDRAFAGADALFLLAPVVPWLDRLEANAFAAAAHCGISHVIKLSTTRPDPDSPIPWWRSHWRAEQRLKASDLAWTILRPNGISSFLLDHAVDVRTHGMIRTSAGAGRMALVDPYDVAAAAVCAIEAGPTTPGATLDLTGPEALSYADVAATMTKVIGHHVTHVDLVVAQASALLTAQGHPDWYVEGVLANWRMTRDGSGGFDRVSADVERVTGRPPRALSAFLAEHAVLFTPEGSRAGVQTLADG